MKIPENEFKTRTEALREYLLSINVEGVILFDNYYILYYCGFAFIPTERPIAFVMNVDGEQALYVPYLEKDHAESKLTIDRVHHYQEYPDNLHPIDGLLSLMKEMGIRRSFCSDKDGYPLIFGYRGPTLTALTGIKPLEISDFIEKKMAIKSPTEILLIKESSKWGNLAHTLLQRYTRPGITETDASLRASTEATRCMLDAIGPIYQSQSAFESGAHAGYRGQIGRNASIPHSLAANIVFQSGDVLVSGANAPVWGYNSELERTMIIGAANDDQKYLFDHMLVLQETALNAIQPGIPCSEVDQQVRAYYLKHDLMNYWKHHVGHAIGLRYHEGPFLDLGDHTEIKPGMVFTVEPGLYAGNIGGFRHSDTVLVNEEGIEFLTYYPRNLESLTIPI
jgi:Xaa-Pro aminopeptidase